MFWLLHQRSRTLTIPILPRKMFFHEAFQRAQLKGIGGPGAPHLLRLDRISDLGLFISGLFGTFVVMIMSVMLMEIRGRYIDHW